MANAIYPAFKQQLLNKEHDLNTDVIKAVLVDLADYVYSAAHSGLSDIPAAARVAISGALTSPTIASGVFDTADFSWTAVSGDPCEAIILYNDTHATDALIAYFDTGMTGMPVTPNGGDITLTVNASGWFTL